MAELTEQEWETFSRVSRWREARRKTRKELVSVNARLTKLRDRKTVLQARIDRFDERVQTALDAIKARIP